MPVCILLNELYIHDKYANIKYILKYNLTKSPADCHECSKQPSQWACVNLSSPAFQ